MANPRTHRTHRWMHLLCVCEITQIRRWFVSCSYEMKRRPNWCSIDLMDLPILEQRDAVPATCRVPWKWPFIALRTQYIDNLIEQYIARSLLLAPVFRVVSRAFEAAAMSMLREKFKPYKHSNTLPLLMVEPTISDLHYDDATNHSVVTHLHQKNGAPNNAFYLFGAFNPLIKLTTMAMVCAYGQRKSNLRRIHCEWSVPRGSWFFAYIA